MPYPDKVDEHLTDAARKALALASEEARLLNHSFVGTEHVLLGLIHGGMSHRQSPGSLLRHGATQASYPVVLDARSNVQRTEIESAPLRRSERYPASAQLGGA